MREALRALAVFVVFLVVACFLSSGQTRESLSQEATTLLPSNSRVENQVLVGSQVTFDDETGRMVHLCGDLTQKTFEFYGVTPTEAGSRKAVAVMLAPAETSGRTDQPGELFFDLRE